MTDPTFHLVGNFLELNQITSGPKYIRKDEILLISTSTHRVTLHMKGRVETEGLSFVNSENQQRFVQQLLADISPEDVNTVPFKDCLNAVKDAMENVKRMQCDLSASLDNMTSKIEELKEDVKKDLQDYIDESLEVETEESQSENISRYDALDGNSTNTVCNTLVAFLTLILIFFGVVSIQKNLKVE